MTNFNVARSGYDGTDATALFLKVFPGEILAAYERANVMGSRHQVRTIKSGKSAQFPAFGRATASYHTPGVTLQGSTQTNAERVITIDGVLQANRFVADIDEAMQHYDYRGILAKELGEALARANDLNVIRTAILTGRDSVANPDGNTGGRIQNADLTGDGSPAMTTEGDALAEAFFRAGQMLDEKFVPDEGRFGLVRPAQYSLLTRTTEVLNKDWGGSGSYADGNVRKIAGIEIVKTNNLVNSDESADTSIHEKYRVDSRNVCGLIMHPTAVATVKLMDLAMRQDYMPREIGTFILAKQAVGHGGLRGEAVVELRTAAP